MPSGQTHDQISLVAAPIVAMATYRITGDTGLAIAATSGHLFSSFLLSPDLDLHSNPYKRWGWLRWIWIPYQKQLKHRSIWSHGFLIGTTGRCLYLAIALSLAAALSFALFILVSATLQLILPGSVGWIIEQAWKIGFVFAILREALVDAARLFFPGIDGAIAYSSAGISEWMATGAWKNWAIAGFVGLEIGAACHYVADWVTTFIKENF